MDGYEPSPDAPPTENAFSGEQETLDSADTYTDDLNRRAEDAERAMLLLGLAKGMIPVAVTFQKSTIVSLVCFGRRNQAPSFYFPIPSSTLSAWPFTFTLA